MPTITPRGKKIAALFALVAAVTGLGGYYTTEPSRETVLDNIRDAINAEINDTGAADRLRNECSAIQSQLNDLMIDTAINAKFSSEYSDPCGAYYTAGYCEINMDGGRIWEADTPGELSSLGMQEKFAREIVENIADDADLRKLRENMPALLNALTPRP